MSICPSSSGPASPIQPAGSSKRQSSAFCCLRGSTWPLCWGLCAFVPSASACSRFSGTLARRGRALQCSGYKGFWLSGLVAGGSEQGCTRVTSTTATAPPAIILDKPQLQRDDRSPVQSFFGKQRGWGVGFWKLQPGGDLPRRGEFRGVRTLPNSVPGQNWSFPGQGPVASIAVAEAPAGYHCTYCSLSLGPDCQSKRYR